MVPVFNKKGGIDKFKMLNKKNTIEAFEFVDTVVIDESSMIDKNTLDLLREVANEAGFKIIFMGDIVQLPPVQEKGNSKVFDIKGAELTERMRQGEDSPIVEVTDIVADIIEDMNEQEEKGEKMTPKLPVFSNKTEINEKGEGVEYINGPVFSFTKAQLNRTKNTWDTVINKFLADFEKNPETTKFVTLRNNDGNNNKNDEKSDSAYSVNKLVREKLFGAKAVNPIMPGEILVTPGPSNAFNEAGMSIAINTNDTIKVIEVEDEEIANIPNTDYSFTIIPSTVTLPDIAGGDKMRIYFLKTAEDAITHRKAVRYYQSILANSSSSDNAIATAQKALTRLSAYIVPEYGYAVTAHKAQGSTFTTAYVLAGAWLGMAGYLMTKNEEQSIREMLQGLYTATSRPSKKLVMVNATGDSGKSTKPVNVDKAAEDFNENNDLPPIDMYDEQIEDLEGPIDAADYIANPYTKMDEQIEKVEMQEQQDIIVENSKAEKSTDKIVEEADLKFLDEVKENMNCKG
jgi:hypothetical protein